MPETIGSSVKAQFPKVTPQYAQSHDKDPPLPSLKAIHATMLEQAQRLDNVLREVSDFNERVQGQTLGFSGTSSGESAPDRPTCTVEVIRDTQRRMSETITDLETHVGALSHHG